MGTDNKGFHNAVFSTTIWDDSKSPERYAVYLSQAGLGLPDRDYYLEAKFAAEKAKYQTYVARMLREAGWPQPEARAAEIVAFETRIAQVSWTRAERRDDDKTYNPMSIAELQAAAPGFPWKAYLAGADLGAVQRVIVSENTAIPKIAAIYAATPLPTLQAWSAFHFVDAAAPYLPKRFVDARFEFRSKELQGQPSSGSLEACSRPRRRGRWARPRGALRRAPLPTESKAKMDAWSPI
jgi:putative endopeptidase